MNRLLTVILAWIGIGILVCTLFLLTRYSIRRVFLYFMTFKETKGKGMKFSDYMLFLFRLGLTGLFIYDWGIFFVEMYKLIEAYLE